MRSDLQSNNTISTIKFMFSLNTQLKFVLFPHKRHDVLFISKITSFPFGDSKNSAKLLILMHVSK